MTDPVVEVGRSTLMAAVEYLLEVRQRQLGEELSELSRRGDREWSRRLWAEADDVSRLLQALRSENEGAAASASSCAPSSTPPAAPGGEPARGK